MRLNTAALIGIAMGIAPLLSTTAISAPTEPRAKARVGQIIAVADACPAGQRWVAAGYAKHGKWRPGHCAKDWTAR
jgi:hypothetical protein